MSSLDINAMSQQILALAPDAIMIELIQSGFSGLITCIADL